jgi:CheY-like chemotaxis protein
VGIAEMAIMEETAKDSIEDSTEAININGIERTCAVVADVAAAVGTSTGGIGGIDSSNSSHEAIQDSQQIPMHISSLSTPPNSEKKGEKGEEGVERGEKRGAEREQGKKALRVLAVDDSALNRKMLSKLLKAYGHTVDEVGDGQSALDRVKQSLEGGGDVAAYDVILMDSMMPGMDGPTATQRIRLIGYTGLIFGATGNAGQSDIDVFLASGANGVLVKPIDIDHFEEAVQGKLLVIVRVCLPVRCLTLPYRMIVLSWRIPSLVVNSFVSFLFFVRCLFIVSVL